MYRRSRAIRAASISLAEIPDRQLARDRTRRAAALKRKRRVMAGVRVRTERPQRGQRGRARELVVVGEEMECASQPAFFGGHFTLPHYAWRHMHVLGIPHADCTQADEACPSGRTVLMAAHREEKPSEKGRREHESDSLAPPPHLTTTSPRWLLRPRTARTSSRAPSSSMRTMDCTAQKLLPLYPFLPVRMVKFCCTAGTDVHSIG